MALPARLLPAPDRGSGLRPVGDLVDRGGAVLPVVALSARGLGASIAVAALFVGLTGLAEIAAAVPAGVLVERIGERRAIVLAGVVDAVACLLALVAPSLWVLALGGAAHGAVGGDLPAGPPELPDGGRAGAPEGPGHVDPGRGHPDRAVHRAARRGARRGPVGP